MIQEEIDLMYDMIAQNIRKIHQKKSMISIRELHDYYIKEEKKIYYIE
jgi:hypothetical protein